MTAPSISLSRVWCAIPVYNNAASIADIATRARQHLTNVIVIDDGSTDADLAEHLKSLDVAVIRHPINLGKGAALLTAFRHAHEHGAQYVITLDGDGQHFPEDIPRFFPHLAPDSIAIGHRAQITGTMPRSSQFGREFSDFWIYVETGKTVLDSQSGFRAYPLPASLDLKPQSIRYGFEVEILTKAFWSGLRTQSVPIRVFYPPREERISSFHPVRDNARLTRLHARLIARQLLPITHPKILLHRRAAENAEEPTVADASVFPPLPLGEGWGEGESGTTPAHPISTTSLTIPPPPLSPLLSALTTSLTMFFGIILWPWAVIPMTYVVLRLHLHKLLAVICILLCLLTPIATASKTLGHALLHLPTHPYFERFIGAHLIALPASLAAGALAYTVTRKLHPDLES